MVIVIDNFRIHIYDYAKNELNEEIGSSYLYNFSDANEKLSIICGTVYRLFDFQ